MPLVLLSAQRCILAASFAGGESGSSWWRGLRFDLAGAGWLLVPALLAATCAALLGRFRLERFALVVPTWLVGVAAAVEVRYFAEFCARFDGTALEYLDAPLTAVRTTTWTDRGTVLAGAAVVTALTWANARLVRRLQGGRVVRTTGHVGVRIVALLLAAVAARGGLGRPLRPADAAAPTHLETQLTLSGPWCLMRAAYERRSGDEPDVWTEGDAAALATARAPFGATEFPRDDRPMLRRVTSDAPRRNVVIVVMESMAARWVGALSPRAPGGANGSWTPRLDELFAERGTLFPRHLANGPSTNRALVALLAGLPSTPRASALTKSLEGQRPLLTLGRLLGESGWSTAFVTGGDPGWENLGGWCAGQGFVRVVDGEGLAAHGATATSVWGVPDGELLRGTLELCDDLAADGPFCTVVLTSSNHPPFAVPGERAEGVSQREHAVRYVDDAVAGFVRDVAQRPWGEETVLALVGDHGVTELGRDVIDPERHHVLFWVDAPGDGAARSQADRFGGVSSHVDVLPTVLSLCGYEGDCAAWGDALLPQRPIVGTKMRTVVLGPLGTHQVLATTDGETFVVDRLRKPPGEFTRFRWLPSSPTPDDFTTWRTDASSSDADAASLARHGRAVLHVLRAALREARAGR